MKILAIGNSYSQDATYYLHQAAAAVGVEIDVVNLYIGGCALETHYRNSETEEAAYLYEHNGKSEGRMVSLKEALCEQAWDVITLQQASYDSGWLDSYEPFFGCLVSYVKNYAPQAKLYLHKTWAYDNGSSHGSFMRYNRKQSEMYARLSAAYAAISEKYNMPMIATGDVVQALRATQAFTDCVGENSIMRDGFHLHYLYGRYAAALTWLKTLSGVDATENTYIPQSEYTDEKVDAARLQLVRETVDGII